jgi:hypothetical protein
MTVPFSRFTIGLALLLSACGSKGLQKFGGMSRTERAIALTTQNAATAAAPTSVWQPQTVAKGASFAGIAAIRAVPLRQSMTSTSVKPSKVSAPVGMSLTSTSSDYSTIAIRVSGRVRDNATGYGLESAYVYNSLTSVWNVTDRSGYYDYTFNVDLPANHDSSIDLALCVEDQSQYPRQSRGLA